MKIAIGVVTYNGADHVDRCLESLLGQTLPPVEITIVDNASSDATVDHIEAAAPLASRRKISMRSEMNGSNLGYTSAANQILRRYKANPKIAEVVVLINQDAYLDVNCLQEFAEVFHRKATLGAAGPKIYYPDSKTIQYAGGYLEQPRGVGRHTGHHETDTGQFDQPENTEFITGAVMALRVSCLETIGCFDEVFSPGYYEDVDLCDRLRDHDWTVEYIPRALAWHHESSSFSHREYRLRLAQRNRLLYQLPRLCEPDFENRFRTAEFDAIATLLVPDELRALAQACLELISRLRFFLVARSVPDVDAVHPRLASLLRQIRHAATDRLIGVD